MSDSCKSCRFYLVAADPDDDYPVKGVGWCRRRAPVIMPDYEGVFPLRRDEDWCGEYCSASSIGCSAMGAGDE